MIFSAQYGQTSFGYSAYVISCTVSKTASIALECFYTYLSLYVERDYFRSLPSNVLGMSKVNGQPKGIVYPLGIRCYSMRKYVLDNA